MKSKFFGILMVFGFAMGLVLNTTSCKKEDDKLPPIDGYNNADEVAASNLIAYWPLNGDGKEAKSGASPTTVKNVTYVDGKKGKAAKLAEGLLGYDEIANLNSLPNMTVSLWANFDNNGSAATVFFSMSRPNEWAGNINLMSETGWKKAGVDTLVLKGLVVTNVANNPSFQDSRNEPSKGGVQAASGINKWNHIVMTWDGATSNFKIYQNGVKVSNPEWEQRGTTGPLNFFTPTKPIIGGYGTLLPGGGTPEAWQKAMTGMVDEVRVYNKALSDAEIGSLFKLESAGR
ncbi:MAG: LamG domain-containing protein [Saprospiraceae bacterium]|nr:MAG: hypothetical protein UZ09_BCD002001233 [Bacteroidetes bacterium OLB9]MCO6463963.1 LamG domain-containing protein [Saprospiraceae bacterium]MCZ2339862.1 LamG domain-containing protein [Chitinophagales bacterium]